MSRRAWGVLVAVVLVIIVASLYYLGSSGDRPPATYADIGEELGSGRIELAEAGFALTTPEGWVAWAPGHAFQDWWGAADVIPVWIEPRADADTWWMGTCGIGEVCTRERMAAAGGQAYCWVVDDTEAAAEEDRPDPSESATRMADALVALETWTGVEQTVVELDAGRTGLVSATDPNGWGQTIFHFADGERRARLVCGTIDSDVDPLSIAETFAFLPAEA